MTPPRARLPVAFPPIRLAAIRLALTLVPLVAVPVKAADPVAQPSPATPAHMPGPAAADMASAVAHLAHEWARINYQVTDQDQQDQQMQALASEAAGVVARYPGRAEPLTWQAIILCSQAGYEGGLGAYHLVQTARDLLQKAASLDYRALDGEIPVNLGVLYYKVPSFPIGFGSTSKARHYLEDAIAINPDGLDSNLFYGEFLSEQGEYAKAIQVLEHGLAAPVSATYPVWDAGRRREIKTLLDKVRAEAADGDGATARP